ncbi:MAG: 50S ribosomal protein L4 [Candidatus Omnitrophica bacterium]|nr:50S ribosomal protein L4 [Candidatus Omnitrophota bacterium]
MAKEPVKETKRSVAVLNTSGKEVARMELDPAVFDGKVNEAVIHQAVTAYRASRRKGLAATKTRGEVSGGGAKPWRQKGSGRARVGSSRNPLWRGGGAVFGPHPRDYTVRIPERIRRSALRSSLNAKLNDDDMIVIDELKVPSPRTKEAQAIAGNLHIGTGALNRKRPVTALMLIDKPDRNTSLAFRNISRVDVYLAKDVNCYDVLAHRKLVITRDSLSAVVSRLKGG